MFDALLVEVRDASGQPVPGVPVTFRTQTKQPGMAFALNDEEPSNQVAVATNGIGLVVLNKMIGSSAYVYYGIGAITITAEAPGATTVVFTGTVTNYIPNKGIGFIQRDDGAPNVLAHISVIQTAGLQGLSVGQKVRFQPGGEGTDWVERISAN